MAVVEDKKQDQKEHEEVRDILAQMRPLYQDFTRIKAFVDAFAPKLRGFETHICTLLNWEEGYQRRVKAAEGNIAQMEQAAKTRIATMEHGHRTLVDDLSRKQLEADRVKADYESLKRTVIEERAQLAALKDHYERLIGQVNATPAAKKAAGK